MPKLTLENALRRKGKIYIAGIDEAGRGPLAGPVSAAAVILPPRYNCKGLDDSKKLCAKKRRLFYHRLTENPQVVWAVAMANVQEIELLNILRATHLAMHRAVDALSILPHHCLVDGLPVRDFRYPHDGVVKGDTISLSIAAASVIAKVARDAWMSDLHEKFPDYGFSQHQGYGTPQHLEALRLLGPCEHHRRLFQPVAQLSLQF